MRDLTQLTTEIYKTARECSEGEYVNWVFEQVPSLIPCSSQAWTYLLADKLNNDYRVISPDICGIEDVEKMLMDYEKVKAMDPLVAKLVGAPGQLFYIDDDDPQSDVHPKFRDFTTKYDFPKSMAMSIELPRTKNLHVFALWRRRSEPRFSDDDAAAFEQLLPHLIQGRIHCREFSFKSRMLDPWAKYNSIATFTDDQLIIDMEARFSEILRLKFPESISEPIPEEVMALLSTEGPDWLRVGDVSFRRYHVDSTDLIVATQLGALAKLSNREIDISRKFAEGSDHKLIAFEINRSAATVRNHLRNVYQKLDISSRSELAEMLSRLSPVV